MMGDILPGFGLNIFSLICLIIMLLWSFRVALKTFAPFSAKKLMLIIIASICPPVFFVCCFDLLPIAIANTIVLSIKGNTPIPYISQFIVERFEIILPTSIPLLLFSGIFTRLYMRKNIRFKWIPPMIAFAAAVNFSLLWFFNSYNVRLISEPAQTQLYFVSFIPSWALFTATYCLLFLREKRA